MISTDSKYRPPWRRRRRPGPSRGRSSGRSGRRRRAGRRGAPASRPSLSGIPAGGADDGVHAVFDGEADVRLGAFGDGQVHHDPGAGADERVQGIVAAQRGDELQVRGGVDGLARPRRPCARWRPARRRRVVRSCHQPYRRGGCLREPAARVTGPQAGIRTAPGAPIPPRPTHSTVPSVKNCSFQIGTCALIRSTSSAADREGLAPVGGGDGADQGRVADFQHADPVGRPDPHGLPLFMAPAAGRSAPPQAARRRRPSPGAPSGGRCS